MRDDSRLSTEECRLIGACLRAASEGPFFDDEEFCTLFGLSRSEVSKIASRWPQVDDEVIADLAINNAMNNLLGYPQTDEESLSSLVNANRVDIEQAFVNWRLLCDDVF